MTLTVGSLFSGIGGMDLLQNTIAAFGVENDKAAPHKLNGNFFQLIVPLGMLSPCGDGKVVRGVVPLVQVDVVHTLVRFKRAARACCCYLDVFGKIPALLRVWMFGGIDIPVPPVRDVRSFCGPRLKDTPAAPIVIGRTGLIAGDGAAGWNAHLEHSSPYYLLASAEPIGNLLLRHVLIHVTVEEFLFRNGTE